MIVLCLVGWLGGSASYAQLPGTPGGPAPSYPAQPMPASPPAPPPGTNPAAPGAGYPAPNFTPPPPGAYPYPYVQPGMGPYPAGPPGVPGQQAFPMPGQPGPGPGYAGVPGMPPGPPPGMMPCPCPLPEPPCTLMPEKPMQLPVGPSGMLPWFFGVEYLNWWVKRPSLPPLLTVGDLNDFTFGGTVIPGAIGAPSTHVLLNQFQQGYAHSGLRLNTGLWFDAGQNVGIQGSFLWLNPINDIMTITGDGSNPNMVIARPYIDTTSGLESAFPVVVPGQIGGRITISNYQQLLGAESNLVVVYGGSQIEQTRLSLLLGGRFLSYTEKLRTEQIQATLPDALTLQGGPLEGITENFTSYNRFYGAQIGGQSECILGDPAGPHLYLQVVAKLAVGYNSETMRITGGTNVITPADPNLGLPQTLFQSPYTLLVGPTNSGTHTRSVLSLVPEGQCNVGWVFNDNLMLSVGYTMIYWTNMVRPGNNIDRVSNIQNINDVGPTSPNNPNFLFRSSDIWIQGFQVAITVSF